jgi:uncharacterized protein (DUF1800 family)
MEPRAHIAVTRFGLGLRQGEALPSDPLAWLDGQLGADPGPPIPAGFATPPGTREGFAAFRADREAQARGEEKPKAAADLFRAEAAAQAERLVTTTQPYRERLVQFWANHFTCSRRVGMVGPLMGAYLRDAIRPHVTGPFAELLLAVARHPAMLVYLDNAGSVGPDSQAGGRRGAGLNENLAREILELHTLSPAAGYTQADVTEFAKVLTGWSVGRANQPNEPAGVFMFRPRGHQPGPKQVLGQHFEAGEAGGIAALRWLAAHPATQQHLATKLARHFIGDTPPPAVIAKLAAVLRSTGGNLGAVARALPRQPEAWTPLAKLRSPQDFVVAAFRAIGAGPASGVPALNGFAQLGQPLWAAPGPNGWPDLAADWAAPEALLRRVDFSWAMAGRAAAAGMADARGVAEATLGPLARAETVTAIARAGSQREALTLLLASPEFQRR